jgi:hypothetical protein
MGNDKQNKKSAKAVHSSTLLIYKIQFTYSLLKSMYVALPGKYLP